MGDPGSGQTAKLFNNTLLMMNQANIAELIELAVSFGTDPSRLVDVLKLGSASSQALTLLNTMVTLDTVDHLSKVEAEDMQIFANAMSERHLTADTVTARGLARANGLTSLLHRLNP